MLQIMSKLLSLQAKYYTSNKCCPAPYLKPVIASSLFLSLCLVVGLRSTTVQNDLNITVKSSFVMKKILLASALSAVAFSTAHAAPKVYGKVFVTTDYINFESDVMTRLGPNETTDAPTDYDKNALEINSHSSRLGIKGSESISDETEVVYQLEYGFSIDGDKDGFKNRDTYLGLANKRFGELRLGRNSSVLGKVNNVTLTEGYWDNLGDSKLNKENELRALNMLDDSRQNNSIVWFAPQYKELPIALALQYAADESLDNSKNGYGASLMFDKGTGFTAGIAYSKDMDMDDDINLLDPTDTKEKNKVDYGGEVIRATATADLTHYINHPVTLGVMYQQADYDFAGSDKEKGLVVSAKMGLNSLAKPTTVYVQYNKTDNLNGFSNSNSDQVVLGGTYQFKKDITGHAYIGQNSADYVAVGKVNKVNKNGKEKFDRYDVIESDINVFAFGAGLEYKF